MNKREVLKYIKQKNRFHIHELIHDLNYISSNDFKKINVYLNELTEDNQLFLDKDGYYIYTKNKIYEGILSLHKKGFGFVKIDDENEFHISEQYINHAMDKDKVLIECLYSNEARVVSILERSQVDIVGTLQITKKGKCLFIPDNETIQEFYVEMKNAYVSGLKVLVHIEKYQPLKGSVRKIIGHKNNPGVDIMSLAYKYGIEDDFPKEVYQEVETISPEIDPSDIKNRIDLRDMMIVSIDGESAKDLDDAISLRVLENYNYELGVHIADVSFYVQEGSNLDKEAVKRGTSIYLVDRVIPMLPHALSNGICSLNEGVDRYTISCFMEINKKGDVVNYRILPTVINNKHRMTYTNVNKIIHGDQEMIEKYHDAYDLFLNMKKLHMILNKQRVKSGAIDFDTKEAIIDVDKNGKPIDIRLRERGESERYIESFMLIANETIAKHFYWLELPFIYRVHENPKQKKLLQFLNLARPLGYTFKGSLDKVKPKQIAKLLETSKGKIEHPIISTLLLRSMQKARYDADCLGHFGLADEYYTHFTSPIRRYPDLLVHRLIRNYIFNENYNNIEHFEKVIPELALSSSACERKAIDLEREVDDMKKAEYMENHVGEVYTGMVSSITSFGMFVELENSVEGLIHISELKDDYYIFLEDQLILLGRKTHHIYRISDKVKVRVTKADKWHKQIDFEIVSNKRRHEKYESRRK